MVNKEINLKYDWRLSSPLDFVCKILDVTREDFASLAISNLLQEELDWIDNNGYHADVEEIKNHKEIVNLVKY